MNPTEIVVIGIAIFVLGICFGCLARADWEIRPARLRKLPKPGIPLARVLEPTSGGGYRRRR